MTENSSKGSTPLEGVYSDLNKKYGCFGIKSVDGWSVFVEQWFINGGSDNAMGNAVVIINSSTRQFTAWTEEIFKP